MFLQTISIQNFRSCEKTMVYFEEDLTVLAGPNNAGKTNVLDAIRLITGPIDGRWQRYAEEDDVRRGTGRDFTVEAEFAGLNKEQRGLFITAIGDHGTGTAKYGLRYAAPEIGSRRGTLVFWAGAHEGGDPEPEARALLRHVHLPALRDAQRELASANPYRIAFLLKHLSKDEDEIKAFEDRADTAFRDLEEADLIKRADQQITAGLESLTVGVQSHAANLRFAEAELRRLARDLRFFLVQRGLEPADLAESGLGYANLLYLATVLVELQAAKDTELTLFLVEEPEAHLHPQLQAVTLEYLKQQAQLSKPRTSKPGIPDGKIQVIVTTHSPHMTSAVSVKHVVVLRDSTEHFVPKDAKAAPNHSCVARPKGPRRAARLSQNGRGSPSTPVTAPRPSSTAIPIVRLGLDDDMVGKIDRYLDVTRSALLFSQRVVLVEGLAEALLLPAIAHKCLLNQASQRDDLVRFQATTLVAIGGVDFEPYIRLLLTPFGTQRLAERVVVITDEDPSSPDSRRPERLMSIAAELQGDRHLDVCVSENTLEAELFSAGNHEMAKRVFLELHPLSGHQWSKYVEDRREEDQPNGLVELLRETRTRKGDFAQRLAKRIQDGEQFRVPEYLRRAILAAVGAAL